MIVTTIIASIDNSKVHCEWYSDTFTRYETLRQQIKKFLLTKNFQKYEILSLTKDLTLHFLTKNGIIFIIVYKSPFPKKLGKAALSEIRENFENFVQTQSGSKIDVYSYVATLKQSYSLLKFGILTRQVY